MKYRNTGLTKHINVFPYKNISILLSILCFFSVYLSAFSISTYDFRLPTSSSSPIEAALGGINVTSANDYYLVFSNPALIRHLKQSNFSLSYGFVPEDYDEFEHILRTAPSQKDNYYRGMAFQAKQIGLGHQVLASDKYTLIDSLAARKIYQNYRLESIAAGISDSVGFFNYGFTGKFIFGRMVYFSEYNPSLLRDDTEPIDMENYFIDSTSYGYSFDLGLNARSRFISTGVVFYDVYSMIDWKGQTNGKIKPRLGMGTEMFGKNFSYGIATNSKAIWKQDPFYSLFTTYKYTVKNQDMLHTTTVRFSMTSKTFHDQDKIFFNFGFGYFYKIVRLDAALQSKGWKANETQYLISLSLGE